MARSKVFEGSALRIAGMAMLILLSANNVGKYLKLKMEEKMKKNMDRNKLVRIGKPSIISVFAIAIIGIMPLASASADCPNIGEKYDQLGGSNGFLGQPISGEVSAPGGGSFQNFEHGSIYWSPQTCANEIHGPILEKYLAQDYNFSLGYPITDTISSKSGGLYNYFEGGAIFWKTRIGAHALNGKILKKWEDLGRENSSLGYPMTDVMPSNNTIGKYEEVYFEKNDIYVNTTQDVPPIVKRDALESGYYETEFGTGYIIGPERPRVTNWTVGNIDLYRINDPFVRTRMQQYPDITFKKGDSVKVEAGGCVQRRGLGSSWNRYVDPLDEDGNPIPLNANGLYYGLIFIESAYDKQGRFGTYPIKEEIENSPLHVTNDTVFASGYVDDDYDKNGYFDHDDGDADQCKDVGPAWIVLTVKHNVEFMPIGWKSFDVAWEGDMPKLDDNFIPLNPKWGLEATKNQHPDPFNECGDDLTKEENWNRCTNQEPKFDLPHGPTWWSWLQTIVGDIFAPTIVSGPGGTPGILDGYKDLATTCRWHSDSQKFPYGHVNWMPVTYEGNISWDSHSSPGTDDDYNLYEVQNSSLTLKSRESSSKGVKLEFDSDETIDNFDTYWWKEVLRKAVDDTNDDFVRLNLIDGDYAIVTGQASIDGEHTGPTELHPVWAMAIRLRGNPALPNDEYWAMFVRNWGNEGFCSSNQHYLDDLNSNIYTFRLPWKQGASDVETIWGKNDVSLDTYFLSRDIPNPIAIEKAKDHTGVQVKFKMTSPREDGSLINGQLHLRWNISQNVLQTLSTVPKTELAISSTQYQEQQSEEHEPDVGPEYYLGKLFSQMTPEQQNILLSNLPKKDRLHGQIASQRIDTVWVPTFNKLLPGQTYKSPTVRSEIDNNKIEKDNQTMNAWIAAFGNESEFLKALLSVSAEASASRTIENQTLHSGSSTIVTVEMKSNISQSLSLKEKLPPKWNLVEVSNGGADTFNNNEWKWSNVGANDTKTVIYRLNIPSDAEARTYYINGSFSGYNEEILRPVSGQNTIKVVAEIRGTKWEDLNANGKLDAEEQVLPNWEIKLNGTASTGENINITTNTDANGNYSFKNLTAGTYIVSEKLVDGWIQTTPSIGNYTVSITSGAVITGKDFGNFHKGKITGGGNIPNATFGIVGQYPDNSSSSQGNVEYQDRIANLNIRSIQINTTASTVDKKKGVITGLARVNGKGLYPFEIYVEDNAEPGKGSDIFNIYLPTYPYSNGAVLSSGNIQIHE